MALRDSLHLSKTQSLQRRTAVVYQFYMVVVVRVAGRVVVFCFVGLQEAAGQKQKITAAGCNKPQMILTLSAKTSKKSIFIPHTNSKECLPVRSVIPQS